MASIPPEFKQFYKFLQVSNALKSRNRAVSDYMSFCFKSACEEYAEERPLSPQARAFLQNLQQTTPNVPNDIFDTVQDYANTLYLNTFQEFQKGHLTENLVDEFFILTVIYSSLDGDVAIEREKASKYAYIKLKKRLAEIKAKAGTNSNTNTTTTTNTSSGAPPAWNPPPFYTGPGASNQLSGPPVYTPPGAADQLSGPPVYTPPGAANQLSGPPVYTPPGQSTNYPNFTPQNNNIPPNGPPVFTPGNQNTPSGPPVFIPGNQNGPPAFTPPGQPSTNYSNLPPQNYNMSSNPYDDPPKDTSTPSNQKAPQNTNQTNPTENISAGKPFAADSNHPGVQLLASMGYKVVAKAPPVDDICKSTINRYFDYSISRLKGRDTTQTLSFLQNAYKTWKTGKPV